MLEMNKKGVLYLVATPIGNLEDMTFRAVRTLGEADMIAAEDTRHTRKLLSHFDIHTPLTSYHEHNKQHKGDKLIAQLLEGKSIALVSDAGTPGISDPGWDLVALALAEEIQVIPVPGPSAVISALIVSGISTERFIFEGFLPRSGKERKRILSLLAQEERTVVFYEAPNRVVKTLEELLELAGDRQAAAARELTKTYEQIVRGKLSSILEHFRQTPPKGEFTVIMEGMAAELKEVPPRTPDELYKMVLDLQEHGRNKKEAIKEVAEKTGVSKREVYEIVIRAEGKKN